MSAAEDHGGEFVGDLADLQHERDELLVKVAKLQKFKDYVHARLDAAGVPIDPDSTHKAEGCRIGGRLDIVLAKYKQ